MPPTVRRLGWLHFWNDFTLDFVTPLLPTGMGIAWIGIMEGAADALGQAFKLISGRASDRTGRRAWWVRSGYGVNAVARPLMAVGMIFCWPLWIIGCRMSDRLGKGLRGSSTDALVADWTSGAERGRAFTWMRTMDHLGATLGAMMATLAAWAFPAYLPYVVAALIVPMLIQLWLCAGIADHPSSSRTGEKKSSSWWPTDTPTRQAVMIVALAAAGRISPILVLADLAGFAHHNSDQDTWPVWIMCASWAVLGLAQAAASALSGVAMKRWGADAVVRVGWSSGAVALMGLALCDGPMRLLAAVGIGILAGITEGAEKTLVADTVPKEQRATAFGALAIASALAALAANTVCGFGVISTFGTITYIAPAGALMIAVLLLGRRQRTS